MTALYRTAAHAAIANAFNPHRFNGYIPDADHKRRQKDSRVRFGASPSVPTQANPGRFRAPILDQGPCGSCTGHGTAQAVFTSSAANGNSIPLPSPDLIYKVTRAIERPNASIALTDSGAMPSDILTTLRQWGVKPMGPSVEGRNSDCALATVNDEPDLLSLETSGLRILTGEYRVDETGGAVIGQIQASLASNACAGIGIFVDSAFENWDPATGPISSINLNDPNGGGHWLSLDYYYMTSSAVILGGPNSWSVSWPGGSGGPSGSPYWQPGCYEITASCLLSVLSDCLLFPVQVLS